MHNRSGEGIKIKSGRGHYFTKNAPTVPAMAQLSNQKKVIDKAIRENVCSCHADDPYGKKIFRNQKGNIILSILTQWCYPILVLRVKD